VVIKKGVEVSRLSGAESVVGQRGKFESHALLSRKPMEILKNIPAHVDFDTDQRSLKVTASRIT